MPFFYRYCAVFFLLLPLAKTTAAQEYIFNHLSTRDGLASNNVFALYQDKKGFLWIGTGSGLQRYDGYHFLTVAANAINGPVHQILEDGTGMIWLRSGKTVGFFDPARPVFKPVPIEVKAQDYEEGYFTLNTDAEKNVFVLLQGAGCFYLNENKTGFASRHTPFQLPTGWKFMNVVDDPVQKKVWVYGSNGLGYYDKQAKRLYAGHRSPAHPLLADPRFASDILNFYIDRRRRYWIEKWNAEKTRKDYYCYDERRGRFTTDTAGLVASGNNSYYEIRRFTEFNDTTVLVYGLNCMAMRENGYFTGFRSPVYTPYSLQFNEVNDVLEDRENILWVATDDGLYNTMANINDNRHLMIGQDKGRSIINCLLEDDARNLWIGTWGRGLIVLDSNLAKQPAITKTVKRFTDEALKLIWSLHQHSVTKKIWIGCQAGTILVYDPKTSGATLLKPSAFGHSTVRQLEEDREGNLWFGLQNGRLFRSRLNRPLQFEEVKRFDGFISRLKLDTKGNLWIAVAKKGIYGMEVKTGAVAKTFSTANGTLSGNDVRDILPLNDSTYVIAGDQLDVLNTVTGTTASIGAYDQKPLGKIQSLQPGRSDECWISTTNGLYRYNLQKRQLTKYNQWDGLITVFNNSYVMETSLRLHNNNLVFGGNQNLVRFNPLQYKQASVPQDVQFTGLQVSNVSLPVDSITALGRLTLPHDQRSVAFSFASLSFTQLEKLTYEYKLEGVDREWITTNLPQPVKYTLLPPGTYRFAVRVKNSEGVYATHTTLLDIIIQPPFWKTAWFFALLLVLTGGLLYYLHRLRVQRLLHVERVRSKLARDLHDDMGSTLSTINILSNMALQMKGLDEEKAKSFMGKISGSTSQMMEAMDDIIWSINPLNDSMGKVLARMKQVAGSVLEPQGIAYAFEAEDSVKGIGFTMEWRREIFLIYKEAINNIVKYAGCTNVDVALTKEAGRFVLSIKDNGIGFNVTDKKEKAPTRGNGFINMKKRAAVMKGQLQIVSAKNGGTQITLRIPFA